MLNNLEIAGGIIEMGKKAIEKSKADLTEEDEIFANDRLSFPRGTVILVSSSRAKNVEWTEREEIFWA